MKLTIEKGSFTFGTFCWRLQHQSVTRMVDGDTCRTHHDIDIKRGRAVLLPCRCFGRAHLKDMVRRRRLGLKEYPYDFKREGALR